MASDTARDQLTELLKPLLPDSWALAPYAKDPGRVDAVLVMLHATEIRPAPSAPGGAVEVDYTVSVSVPQVDTVVAQSALDDDVTTLTLALAGAPWVMFRNATPSTVYSRFGWDVNITTISRKDS